MKIHILGSGSYPLRFTDGRSLSLLLPEHGVVIDAGLGLTALPEDYRTETLHIILSHFHHDHILGLAFLANFLERGQCHSIVIRGDERIKQLMTFFQEPFNPDYTSKLMPITMEYIPESSEISGLQIKRRSVTHASGKSNYFTFTSPQTRFGFGTDTTADTKNADFFKGTKLLLHECFFDNAHKEQAIREGHSYPEVVASLAKAAHIEKLLIIHTDPRYPKIGEEIKNEFPSSALAFDDQIVTI